MTREEAIAYFKRHIDLYCVEGICREAEEMAIKALEQQSCGDVISRRAVLDLINADWKYEGLEEDVSSLSPVTPQPKVGHWIYTGDYITDGMLKCSECGFEHDVSERFAYCPNCGAKMVEPQESEGEE